MDKDYLVMDYTDYKKGNSLERKLITIYTIKELLGYLDNAKKENLKIAVYELGQCVLDWS